jgi:hypothetical protein
MKSVLWFVVPMPTFLVSAFARIRSVETSKPFLTTKFLLIDIGFHSPPVIVFIIYTKVSILAKAFVLLLPPSLVLITAILPSVYPLPPPPPDPSPTAAFPP